jgi:2-dehydropantoate 2-reductase
MPQAAPDRQRVAVLTRGQRAADIRSHGVVLENATTGMQTTTALEVVEQLRPDDSYDLIMVVVRKDQLRSVLPMLGVNGPTPLRAVHGQQCPWAR